MRQDGFRGKTRQFNTSLVFDPQYGLIGWYDKAALMPVREGHSRLQRIWGPIAEPTYHEGAERPVFEIAGTGSSIRFAVCICYDTCFPEIARSFIKTDCRASPQFLVVQGCESLATDMRLPSKMLRITRYRAIETGRSIVRSVEQGYSALIDSAGCVLSQTDARTLTKPVMLGRIPTEITATPYAVCGDWLPIAIMACCGVAGVVRRRP